jgi:hypothetical protein
MEIFMRCHRAIAFAVVALSFSAQVAVAGVESKTTAAKDGVTTTSTTVTSNSDTNYLDDVLTWNHYISAKDELNAPSPVFCIPPKKRLMGVKSSLDTVTRTATPAGGGDPVTSTEQYQAVVLDPRKFWFNLFGDAETAVPALRKCKDVPTPQILDPGTIAYISNASLARVSSRGGYDYGALIVPFKAQLSGKKSFSGSAAIGGYLGYRLPLRDLGLVFSPIVFAGASNISTSATSGGTTTSQTVAGLSYGFGVLTRVKDSFQVGLIVGWDHVDSAQPYQYNNKPWLSFEIGYSFAN